MFETAISQVPAQVPLARTGEFETAISQVAAQVPLADTRAF